MAGRNRIIIGEITQSKVRGKELGEKLFKELNQSEKDSTYQHKDVNKDDKDKHKK